MPGMTLGEAVIRLSLGAVPIVVALAAARRLRHANAEYARGWYNQPLGRLGRTALAGALVGGLVLAIGFGPAILFDDQLPLIPSAAVLSAIPMWGLASLVCLLDRHLWARRHLPQTMQRPEPARPRAKPAPGGSHPNGQRQVGDGLTFRSRRLPNPAPGDIHAA